MNRKTFCRWARRGVVGCLLITLAACPNGIVFIRDTGLEAALRAALGKPLGPLTKQELLTVRTLTAAGRGIQSLDGLENCRFLTTLNLRDNEVEDLAPLEGLADLRWLDLGANRVQDITPLAGLFLLEYVNLFGAQQEIWVWSPLVANALTPGSSLANGGTAVLPTRTTLNADNSLQSHFVEHYESLVDAGVNVIFAEPDGGEIQL